MHYISVIKLLGKRENIEYGLTALFTAFNLKFIEKGFKGSSWSYTTSVKHTYESDSPIVKTLFHVKETFHLPKHF